MSVVSKLALLGAAGGSKDTFFIGAYSTPPYSFNFGDFAIDSLDNIIVGAQSAAFGNSGSDIVILKTDPTGQSLWTKLWGNSTVSDSFGGIAVDSLDNIIVSGATTFSQLEVLVGKFSSSGVLQWSHRLGGTNSESIRRVAITSSDGIIAVGYSYSSPAVSSDVLIYPLNSDGTKNGTSRVLGYTGNDNGTDVAIDTSGNIYVAGTYSTTSGSGGIGANDALIIKLNSALTLQWFKVYGHNQDDFGAGVAVDSLGNVYVLGTTGQTYKQSFLLKLNSSGNILWQKGLGSSSVGNTYGNGGITIDENGDIIITGQTDESGAGTMNAFIAKYDSSGNVLWQNTIGATSEYYTCAQVRTDSLGSIVVSGRAGSSGLLAKLPSDGSRQGTYGSFVYQASTLQDVTLTRTLASPGYYNQTQNYSQVALTFTEQNVSLSSTIEPI